MARSKDYYAVLGVPRDAAPATIKHAYRQLVRRLHPDTHGNNAVDAFREVQAAYETLSDAERRRCYDAALASADVDARLSPVWPGAVRSARPQRAACVTELLLTRREARQGGVLPLRVPVRFGCPACAGNGGFVFPCETCEGDGFLHRRIPCDLALPAGVRDGTVFEVRLQRPVPMTLLLSVTVLAH
jgi:DnaJ-class molecular chaperone